MPQGSAKNNWKSRMGNRETETKRKLLLISYPFPPIPYSGTYRIIRFCKGLTRLGVKVHALSININSNIPNDTYLLEKIPISVTIHRTPIIDPWLRYQKWRKAKKSSKGFKYINKILSLLLWPMTIPDHQIFWIPFAVLQGRKIINKHNIKTIFISSPPNSSQLIGYFLKKFTEVEWIADFRDPIVGNIAETHLINPTDLLSKFEKKILKVLERLVIKNADFVIANTETHRRKLEKKFKENKFVTIRNSFDEDDYKGIIRGQYEKFTIAHVGSMYGLRKADILFKAVKNLEKSLAPEDLRLQIIFVGNNDANLKQSIFKHSMEKYVKIKEMVPHKDAIQIMMRSHLLLLIKATGKGSLGQIPAKFFEYLGAQKSILYIGPEQSEVAQIINKYRYGYTISDYNNEILRLLRREYAYFHKGIRRSSTKHEIEDFSNSKMANKLASMVS
jgi:hypothetical protein